MEEKRRSGRPKKAEHEKVQYQRIAVYSQDYVRLGEEIKRRNEKREASERIKLTDVFTEMVNLYCEEDLDKDSITE